MFEYKFVPSRLRMSVCVCLSVLAGHVHAAPLPEVVQRVLQSHPDIESASALLAASAERIRQSRSNFLPSFGAVYENSRSREDISNTTTDRDINRLDASLKWNLFNGFADESGVRSARLSRQAAAYDLESARDDITLRVVESYLDVMKFQQLVDTSQAQITQLQKLVEAVTVRAEMGRISKVNVHQAKTRLIQAKNRHFQLRAALSGGKLGFRALTDEEASNLELPSFDRAMLQQPIEDLFQQAENANPRIKAEQRRAEARKSDIAVARAGLLPKVDIELRKRIFSDVQPDSSIDQDSSARFMINYEMPLGGATLSQKAEAIDRQKAAQARIQSVEKETRSSMGSLYRQLLEDRSIAPFLEENVVSAKEVVKAYHLQFDAGKRTLLDLLTAYSDLYQAEASVLENQFQQLVSSARLYFQLGTLREVLLD